ncbi:HesB/YadR/YfhF family protein [Cytobacillus horneckiae]|uniref:FeS cluster biogenesis domain-containing protein n=1 Tax=Cytobacillus horneckiae TaxID=549687 RepID=A0A2N0ZIJ4_9BACI|nr:HesB/YadR/YfhF family protein [Cytobacillus horneckiae]MEC1157358.1 HesB/YadR/YfhF family protein [Cytobacillus horneckiae]MED2935761.1 HesB/YadR/YfhF family protein [Cytobacillus horneckiae]PKG29347.1 hypothetical protein CWS20_08740 [Cytobacillus horneckiae]
MNIIISDQAVKWYKDEMLLEHGDYVRYFARYGGSSPIQQGFSLGISNEKPVNPEITVDKDGIHFFIEEKDIWYFDGHDLTVEYDDKLAEPQYKYEK